MNSVQAKNKDSLGVDLNSNAKQKLNKKVSLATTTTTFSTTFTTESDSDSSTGDNDYQQEDNEEDYHGSAEDQNLVWPDPEGVFASDSGITYSDLAFPKPKIVMEENICGLAKKVTKPPRPNELPKNILVIKSDPPTVDIDVVEEFLVHDPLFVEFFNAFLALPSFPEPLRFNIDTGGFEIVSDGKQKLARQIKEAVRSQQLTASMYRLARKHAFSDITIVPLEDDDSIPNEIKIDTSYQVTTLNKDQGIYWIRAERLPIFLESNFYFTYRLAKVISQARIFNDNNEYVIMKLDFTPRPKIKKKNVEEPPPNPKEIITKEMFLNFGDVEGTDRDSYFAQAMEQLNPAKKFISLHPKNGTDDPNLKVQAKSKSSVFQSQYFGVYSPGLAGPDQSEPPIKDELTYEKMFTHSCKKPITPRPTEEIHRATNMLRVTASNREEEELVKPGALVKMYPKQENNNTDSESGIGDMDDKDEEPDKKLIERPIIDQLYNDGSWEKEGDLIILYSKSDLASVIVGAVMKKTLADLLRVSENMIVQDPAIRGLYPSDSLTCISVNKLDILAVHHKKKHGKKHHHKKAYHFGVDKPHINKDNDLAKSETQTVRSETTFLKSETQTLKSETQTLRSVKSGQTMSSIPSYKVREAVTSKWDKPINKPAEEESDADSLLDSDEDFEERDIHFRRNENKWHSLQSLKGIMDFKKFLEGTSGQKYWELWIDIDKSRLITDEKEKNQFIMHLRNNYYKQGAYYELSSEDKKKLGLENISNWNLEYLFHVQPHILEPLILYWAPRYLLHHLLKTKPDRYPMYRQMISCGHKEADPHPNTQALLPLGPKSCCPRSTTKDGDLSDQSVYKYNEAEFRTTPKVGNRRVYGPDTLKRLAQTPSAKYLGFDPKKQPKSLLKGKTDGKFLKSSSKGIVGKPQDTKTVSRQSLASDKQNLKHQFSRSGSSSSKKSFLSRPVSAGEDSGEDAIEKDELKLGPVHKPKDLLSPMLKIVDSKTVRKRRAKTAPAKRSSQEDEPGSMFYRQESLESGKVGMTGVGKAGILNVGKSGIPGDACGPKTIEFTEIKDSDFIGSARMEFLLQALHHEQASGHTFRKFIEKSDRPDWSNNLDFWEKVQNYRKLFYMEKLDLFNIAKMAKSIFARYIVEGSNQNIGVSDSVELAVMTKLSPAYEDLYDQAEEHSLKVLFEAFQQYLSKDVKTYSKVERADVQRRLETKNTYILNLQKQGIIKEGPLTPDDPMDGYVEPVYDSSLLEKIPEQYRDWNLEKLLHNRLELENFRQYLAENYAETDLKCWMDMEAWRRTPPDDEAKRSQRLKDIKKNYLNKKYFFGPSSPAGKEGQNKVMEVGGGWGKFLDDKPHPDSVLQAQKYVKERLEKKHLPLFLATKAFQTRMSPRVSIADSAEDVMVQKKKRSQAVLKASIQKGKESFDTLCNKLTARRYIKEPSLAQSSLSQHLVPDNQTNLQLPILSLSSSSQSNKPLGSAMSSNESYRRDFNLEDTIRGKVVPLPSIDGSKMFNPDMYFISDGLLESKWISSSKDIFLFKHALENPVTCKMFRKYVGLKGDFLENNVLFWQEVQNYKKMNHSHTEDVNLMQKINAIIHCFIDSPIPPPLQIDIPQDMAERILDHKHEKSPYLFREAQLATFRILLQHWQPFCEWRNNMKCDERAMSTLDRHRLQNKERESIRRAQVQEQKEREMELRKELGLGEYDDIPQELFDDELDKVEDKIAFSYSDYIKSLQSSEDSNKLSQLGYNTEENASQTVRGIPAFEGQPIEDRPGYNPKDAAELQDQMFNYSEKDITHYYDYILEQAQKQDNPKTKRK